MGEVVAATASKHRHHPNHPLTSNNKYHCTSLFSDPLLKKARKTSYDFKREMERVMLSQMALEEQ